MPEMYDCRARAAAAKPKNAPCCPRQRVPWTTALATATFLNSASSVGRPFRLPAQEPLLTGPALQPVISGAAFQPAREKPDQVGQPLINGATFQPARKKPDQVGQPLINGATFQPARKKSDQ
jgi:hypothetical protein